MTTTDMWQYRTPSTWNIVDLTGYQVEARDGGIGMVDEANDQTGQQSIVVDTSPWVRGRKVLLPAGAIEDVNHEDRRIFVAATREQVKDAPEYDPDNRHDTSFMEKVSGYYRDLIH